MKLSWTPSPAERAMARPAWHCHSAAEVERFAQWTVARLVEMYEDAADPVEDAYRIEPDLHLRFDREAMVRRAVRTQDHDAFARLATTEQLRRLAHAPGKRGRAKGEPRPSDLTKLQKWLLADAREDARHIREIWKLHYGLRNRKKAPTAEAIAANLAGVPETMLRNYLKTHGR